jgi:hypothetical protein
MEAIIRIMIVADPCSPDILVDQQQTSRQHVPSSTIPACCMAYADLIAVCTYPSTAHSRKGHEVSIFYASVRALAGKSPRRFPL